MINKCLRLLVNNDSPYNKRLNIQYIGFKKDLSKFSLNLGI